MYTRSSGISYVLMRACSVPSISSFFAFLLRLGPLIVTTGMVSAPFFGLCFEAIASNHPLDNRPRRESTSRRGHARYKERGVGTGSAVIGRSEPGGQGVTKALVRAVADPRDVSVGPNQHGSGSSDRAEHR